MESIRVVVVDDHPLFLDGVVSSLESEPGVSVVGQGASASEALRLCVDTLPDVVLLDVNMPGNGITAVRNISQACPVVRIGMLTMSEADDDVMRSLSAGAHGYVLKGISGSELTNVIRSLHNGELYVSPDLAAQLLSVSKRQSESATDQHDNVLNSQTVRPLAKTDYTNDELTVREEQILEGIAEGLSNREIGDRLHIAEKTVKNYVTNILQKLHVRNRVEAAMMARDRH